MVGTTKCIRNVYKMVIETFVFLDLETTGLIRHNEMPKITELSLIAVDRNAILNNENELPRVLYKLVLPIHPDRQIPQKVELLTNLGNKDLEKVKSFDQETYLLIENFINRLTEPICFVAHNGNKFDYPIFLWELKCINRVIRENIYCIDTICVFKDYFSINQINQVSVSIKSDVSTNDDSIELLNDGNDELLCEALDNYISSESLLNDSSCSEISACLLDESSENLWVTVEEKNERTSKNQIIKVTESNIKFKRMRKTKKRLNFADDKPHNFKLITIHEYLTGFVPVESHTAEADCLAMLRCVSQIKKFFIEWADNNAVLLNTFKNT